MKSSPLNYKISAQCKPVVYFTTTILHFVPQPIENQHQHLCKRTYYCSTVPKLAALVSIIRIKCRDNFPAYFPGPKRRDVTNGNIRHPYPLFVGRFRFPWKVIRVCFDCSLSVSLLLFLWWPLPFCCQVQVTGRTTKMKGIFLFCLSLMIFAGLCGL